MALLPVSLLAVLLEISFPVISAIGCLPCLDFSLVRMIDCSASTQHQHFADSTAYIWSKRFQLCYVARDSWNPPSVDGGPCSMDGEPIHGSLHIVVDPVTRGCGEKSTNRVRNPWVGWANSMERGYDGY